MNFKTILNDYLSKLNCSSKELSLKSGLSQVVISRYRNGDRIPANNSIQMNKLVNAIYELAIELGHNDIKKDDILSSFNSSIKKTNFDYETFSKNFDELINELKISIIEMSRFITFDSSYISRIRTGQRKPAYPDEFVDKVCNFVVSKYTNDKNTTIVANILKCEKTDLFDQNIYFNKLRMWLTNKTNSSDENIADFLKNLDQFDLNDYIKSIKFDELKVPNIPFYIIKPKSYYGLKEMRTGELDFLKATVLSKTKEPVFMCNDMPIQDMAEDIEFGKKWIFAIAMILKKGLHLNIIHNLDRPFKEMMLGLQSWIPIYMTGQVSPYYFKDSKDMVYCHLNYTSGSIALTGESIKGFHSKGKYYLTNNKKELEYYKTRTDCLLKKAQSLMNIYDEKDKKIFDNFLIKCEKIKGNRLNTLTNLPLFTLDDDLLISILNRNNISNKDIKMILDYKRKELNMVNNILKNNKMYEQINEISESDLVKEKISLSLENIFYKKKVTYNYDEYQKHLKLTEKFSENNANYNFDIIKNNIFHNIRLTIIDNKLVIISKNKNPIIHFVIKHPKLIESIQNFSPPIK